MPGPRAPLARPRAFGARLQGVVPVASLHIHGADFEAMALTRKQSRIKMSVNVAPKSISARLVLQSAKLARGSLNKKFNHRFWTFANYIENNYNKSMRA